MKSSNYAVLILLVVMAAACSGGGGGSGGRAVSLVSVTVSPKNSFVAPGTSVQFTATGTYSDNSAKDLTASVVWSSSTPSIATISNETGSQGSAASIAQGITAITAVSGGVSGSTSLTVTGGGFGGPGNNVLAITVNGSLCSAGSYPNKPCVSITVCTPGTTTCQTIDDILVDTGSYGLRIFAQTLTVSLPTVASGTGTLAECVSFADGSSDWGTVRTAKVILGGEDPVTVPIQVIDATFAAASIPTVCPNPDSSPAAAGLKGILGVGVFGQDCGSQCANLVNNGVYFSCTNAACKGVAVDLAGQVQNPAAALPVDNNGVVVQLPSVPAGGQQSVDGHLYLGIGTASNNVASAQATTYETNSSGEIITKLNGVTYANSIIDSGSNGLFFTPPSVSQLPDCPVPNNEWFCPPSPVALTAFNTAASGLPKEVDFQIGNFISLVKSPNTVFSTIGGSAPGLFDWGMPFYFGREVYVGFDGTTSNLGSGPYFAY